MKPIDFENVTLPEAKAALDRREKDGKADNKGSEWENRRKPPAPDDLQLQEATRKWIDTLPEKVQPRHLARLYPRVANRLATVWDQASARERELDDLLIDKRGNRQGFPLQVAAEIMALKVHFAKAPAENPLEWLQLFDRRQRR